MNEKWDVIDVLEFHEVLESKQPTPKQRNRAIPGTEYTRDESLIVPRTGNANTHHGKYYKSIVAASADTNIHRYWISRYCDEEVGGWKWVK